MPHRVDLARCTAAARQAHPCVPYGPLRRLGVLQGQARLAPIGPWRPLATQWTLVRHLPDGPRGGWGGALRGLFAPKPSAIAGRSDEGPQGPDRPLAPPKASRDSRRGAERLSLCPLVGSGKPTKRTSDSRRSPGGGFGDGRHRSPVGRLDRRDPAGPLLPAGPQRPREPDGFQHAMTAETSRYWPREVLIGAPPGPHRRKDPRLLCQGSRHHAWDGDISTGSCAGCGTERCKRSGYRCCRDRSAGRGRSIGTPYQAHPRRPYRQKPYSDE
jgi:hypothetical protein